MEYLLTSEERDRVLLGGRSVLSVEAESRKLSAIVNRPVRRVAGTPEGRQDAEDILLLAIMLGTAAGRHQKEWLCC
jgi:hypothetical protein